MLEHTINANLPTKISARQAKAMKCNTNYLNQIRAYLGLSKEDKINSILHARDNGPTITGEIVEYNDQYILLKKNSAEIVSILPTDVLYITHNKMLVRN